ncbi:low temperature requirement protein A [Rhodococcus sp. 1R11]|uniref:low temperature requirement protein A n=1 Tax=Rhodococcus sp. 1R11 TaxID=2559614 RepID=UPI001FD673CD|nr:low temperature requirement protein A [Rhodococcus sp. 1R11]
MTAAMWWLYFSVAQHKALISTRSSFAFGYAHYVIFASAGAISVGIEVAVARVEDRSSALTDGRSAAIFTLPIAIFVLAFWALALRRSKRTVIDIAVPLSAVVIAVSALTPAPYIISAVGAVVVVLMTNPVRPHAQNVSPSEISHVLRQRP